MIHIKIRGRYSATARNNPDKVQVSAIMVGICFYGLCNLFHLNGIDGSVAELAKALNAMINNGIDAENNAKLLHELAMVLDDSKRTANFHTTLVVAAPGRDSLVVDADWKGYIGREPKGDNGFGYDPLFLVGNTGKTAAELSAEEKNEQSHRGQAVKKLMEVFPAWQNKQ